MLNSNTNFQYYNKDGKAVDLNLQVGKTWNEQKTSHKMINTIFNLVDNGDGVVQEEEFLLLKNILKYADTLFGTKDGDNRLVSNELINLINKIKNKQLNLNSLKQNALLDINPNDYNLEAIQKRYPKDKYNIEISNLGDSKYIKMYRVTVKSKDGKNVLNCSIQENKNTKSQIIGTVELVNKKNQKTKYIFEKNKLEYIDDGKTKRTPTEIYMTQLLSKNNYNTAMQLINSVNKDNIENIRKIYSENNGKDFLMLVDEIKDEKIKNYVKNHFSKCLVEYYGYNKKSYSNKKTIISNKHYTGNNYIVSFNNDRYTIKDEKTNTKKIIDLNEITKDFNYRDKIRLKALFQKLPAEFLFDFATEIGNRVSSEDLSDSNLKNANAYYNSLKNCMVFNNSFDDINIDVLVHEIGHAVDFSGYILNTSASGTKMKAIFKKEYDEMIAKDTLVTLGNQHCLESPEEMFAECYTRMMLGSCSSDFIIEKYFPETFKCAKEILAEIRNLPDKKRRGILFS